MVADNPDQKIQLKMFHSEIQNDHGAIAAEEAAYKPIPVIEPVSYGDVMENYIRIKAEVEELLKSECKPVADQSKNDQEGGHDAVESLVSV